MRATSVAAGRAIAPAAATLRARVFQYLMQREAKGATLDEMEEALQMPGNTLRPRRKELETMGIVIDSGAKRPTRTGKQAIVWVVDPGVLMFAKMKLKARGK